MLVLSETVSRARHRIGAILTEHFFDHDRLDVYRLSIEYVAAAFASSRSLEGLHPMNVIRGCERLTRFRSTLPRVIENVA